MDDMHDQLGAHDVQRERDLRDHAAKMETLHRASEILLHRWHQFEDARRSLTMAEIGFRDALRGDWPIEDLEPTAPWFHDGYLIESGPASGKGNRLYVIKKCSVLSPIDGDAEPHA